MKELDNIKLGYSTLSKQIYLYRHGKDAQLALEKRECEPDVMDVLVLSMTDNTPKGSIKTFTLNNKTYKLTLELLRDSTSEVC
jgi:hypothetical protein